MGMTSGGFYGDDFRWAPCSGSASVTHETVFSSQSIGVLVNETGEYEVYVRWVVHPNRTTQAHYRIYDGLSSMVPVGECVFNQQVRGGEWVYCDTVQLTAGNAAVVRLGNDCEAGKYVIADAVRFLRVPVGGTASSTVTTLDGVSSPGTSLQYSRGDHKHAIGTGAISTTNIQDLAVTTPKLADNSVTSAKIQNGTITFADIGQNGCGMNQVMKWSGTAWVCSDISLGAHTHSASDIISGTLDNARFSAYSDLLSEGYLDNNADTDILTRAQADGRYVNVGESNSITSQMISVPLTLFGSINGGNIIAVGNNSSGNGIYGWSTDGYGVQGWNTKYEKGGHLGGIEFGVYGAAADSGNYGGIGHDNYAIYGRHNNSGNYGIIGSNSSGILGYSSSQREVDGESGSGIGVFGGSLNSYGVYGQGATGVYGIHNSSKNYGILGDNNQGIYGYHNNTGNFGLIADAYQGVLGKHNSSSNIGILGHSNGGVLGIAGSSNSHAGYFLGTVYISNWASGTLSAVCKNNDVLSHCGSSLRYKEQIQDLKLGLGTIQNLRPISFKWKGREEYDIGLIAEEVAEIDPILVTYNENGEIEGVKYMQLTAVLINAIKELKFENDELKNRLLIIEKMLNEKLRIWE